MDARTNTDMAGDVLIPIHWLDGGYQDHPTLVAEFYGGFYSAEWVNVAYGAYSTGNSMELSATLNNPDHPHFWTEVWTGCNSDGPATQTAPGHDLGDGHGRGGHARAPEREFRPGRPGRRQRLQGRRRQPGPAHFGHLTPADRGQVTLMKVTERRGAMRLSARIAGIGIAAALLVVASAGMAASSAQSGLDKAGDADKAGVAAETVEAGRAVVLGEQPRYRRGRRRRDSARPSRRSTGVCPGFTTGTHTGGYILGSLGVQVTGFTDAPAAGDQLAVTINDVSTDGGPERRCAP